MSAEARALRVVLARLAERWPGVRVDPIQLAAELADREMAPESRYADDVALSLAMATGDSAALAVFDREIIPSVRTALMRYGDNDFVDEVLQRTRVKLLVREPHQQHAPVQAYRGRGALVAFVQIVAIRESLSARRSSKRELPTDEALLQLAFTEPLLASARDVYRKQLNAAFRVAMDELDARERNLLRMCFLDALSSDEIGRFYGVHRTTAFRWLRDARERLLARTRAVFLAELEISETEAQALMQSLAESLSVVW